MIIGNTEAAFVIDELEKISYKLNDWETNFVDSISNQLGKGKKLSYKQRETINNIWEKY